MSETNLPKSETKAWRGAFLFFLLTFLISWPVYFAGVLFPETIGFLSVYIGGVGPLIAGIVVAFVTSTKIEWREYWHRIYSLRRIALRWYLVIFLLVPATAGFSLLVEYLLIGTVPSQDAILTVIQNPLSLAGLVVFTFFFGPFVEELGWRGYALERLQQFKSPFISTWIVGIIWALWHLPLFFIPGTYQSSELGVGTIEFFIFFLAIIPSSFIITWIFNENSQSTLSAILFHFMLNFTGQMITLSTFGRIAQFCLNVLIVILIIVLKKDRFLQVLNRSDD